MSSESARMNFPIFFFIIHIVNCNNIYVDFMKDYLDSQLAITAVITEFSCDKKSSFELLKAFSERGWQSRSLRASKSNVQYEYVLFNKHLFILRTRCEKFSEILSAADRLDLFSDSYKWILFHDNPQTSLDDILSVLNRHDILVDSDFDVCDVLNGSVSVQKVFKYHQSNSLDVKDWMMWYPVGGLDVGSLEHNVFRRRSDLMGVSLNTCIVIVNNDSLNHLTDKKDKHIDSIAKVNHVLVEHLANIVNISLNYSIKSTWGYKNANNEWSGLMGELTRREADIGGTPLFFTIDRVDYIDYIAMTTPTRSKFIFREPKLSYVANVYTLPFNEAVWISTVLLVILTALVLYISLIWEEKKRNGTIRELDQIPNPSIKDVILVSYGALCQQGSPSIPSSVSGRITTIIMFISLMFLYTSYSANIVALLQSSSNSIQTLEDLLKSRLDVGVDDNVFNRFYFPNATEPIRKALYRKKVAPMGKPDHFMRMEEGVRRIRQGLFAFHMETGPGYKLVSEIFQESEKCGLKEIPFLEVIDPWLAIQKNSTYKKLLKIGLRKIQESGLQSREVALIYTKKPPCVARGSSFISVGIVDCYPAAVVLAGGVILAISVLIVEFLLHKRYFKRLKIKISRRIQREVVLKGEK